jgi:CRP-like cAMP-binding protein
MNAMHSSRDAPGGGGAGERVVNGRILRLVKSGPERHAIESGQVDAVLDAATGKAFLLPDAERALTLARGHIANSLLAALPGEEYRRLLSEFEQVTLTAGEVLYEPGERLRHVYFPNDAHVSLLIVMLDRKALEVGLVGQEGMVGIGLVLGAETSPVRVVVQGSGSALRMKAASFCDALGRCPSLQRELYRYAYAKLLQARQTAACNRFHQVEARLAGWLLLTRDRVRADEFHLTHEILAVALGVRRAGVTNAAIALQRRMLISYQRGNIRILDREGLKGAACACYEIVRNLAS